MRRSVRHLIFALLWLAFFTLAVVVFVKAGSHDRARMVFYSEAGSIVFALGFATIFYSWARADAPVHGKSIKSAVVFTALWLFFNVLAHVAYLFFTRGFREGLLATLKFVSFLLAAGMAWLLFARALGTVL